MVDHHVAQDRVCDVHQQPGWPRYTEASFRRPHRLGLVGPDKRNFLQRPAQQHEWRTIHPDWHKYRYRLFGQDWPQQWADLLLRCPAGEWHERNLPVEPGHDHHPCALSDSVVAWRKPEPRGPRIDESRNPGALSLDWLT